MIEHPVIVTFPAELAALMIALPFAGALVLLLSGRRLRRVDGWLASATVGGSFLIGVYLLATMLGLEAEQRRATVHLWDWIGSGDLRLGVDLLVDQLALVFVLVVTGVATLIHVYSIGYMHDDAGRHRFFAYLNLFVAAMLTLVLADNIVLLFVGWEGVGLCSYLRIGFWFNRPAAAAAANKAFIVNRIGDFSFLLGVFVLAGAAGGLSIGDINSADLSAGTATIAALLLFGGATGKSAQIPLYTWLPDAMEGPTPVSALIHAATMVTAGVYLVCRFSPLFETSGDALVVVAVIGAATALWAALMAATEYDIKRVLAYSTVSQLGYMFMAAGVGAYPLAIFHFVTHAFFKALMFLGAGSVMHALDGEVDMRALGGLRKVMPVTGLTFMAGWLAISGIIPFSGFFSKDAILAAAFEAGDYWIWAVGVATAALTAFYMSRLYFRVFEGPLRLPEGAHPHESPPTMLVALVTLALLALAGGALNLPRVLTLERFLEPVLGEVHVPVGLTEYLLAGASLTVAVAGIALGRALYLSRAAEVRRRRLALLAGPLLSAARNRFYVDRLYNAAFVQPGKQLALWFASSIDGGVIEGLVNGSARAVARFGEGFRRIQTGYVRNYAVVFLLGVVAVVSVLLVRAGA